MTNTEESPIDVRELIAELSVEELNATAEAYFANRQAPEELLAKPFTELNETIQLLRTTALLLQGLAPLPGMRVLEFGAGTCWLSRILAQLRVQPYALDVSRSALELGKELFQRQPTFGERPVPTFLEFDGHRIDLPDGGLDRIICNDAFHHVPNQAEVLREMHRVLRDGGIAGFAEPGPAHSKSPQSQFEMRTATVIENDIVIEDIWKLAQEAGFSDCEVAIFDPACQRVSVQEFQRFLEADSERTVREFLVRLRQELAGHRVFFLRKGKADVLDSRQSKGLLAELQVEIADRTVRVGESLKGTARIRNTGTAVWRHRSIGVGGVALGAQVYEPDGTLVLDYFRCELTQEGTDVQPGEEVMLPFSVPAETVGDWLLEFGLVAEGVGWFQVYGTQAVRVPVTVTPG